jgi:hypothetical protein
MALYPNANWLSDHAMVVSKVRTHDHGEITVASWNMAGTADNWLEFNCSKDMKAFNDYSKEALMALRGHGDLKEFQDSLDGGVEERAVKGDADWGPLVKEIHPGEMESVEAALAILEQGPAAVQTINDRIIEGALPAGGGAAAAGGGGGKIDGTVWLTLYSQYAIVLAYLLKPEPDNFRKIADVVDKPEIDLAKAQAQFMAQQNSTPANRRQRLASTLKYALAAHDIDFACIQEALPDEGMFELGGDYAIVYRNNAHFGPNRETAIVYNKKWRTYRTATVDPHVEWADGTSRTSSGEIMKQTFKRRAYDGDRTPFCVGNAHLTSTGDVETKAIQTKGGRSVDQYKQACELLAGCDVVGIDSNFKGQFKAGGNIPFGAGATLKPGTNAAESQYKLAGDIFIVYKGPKQVDQGTVMKQRGYFQSQLNKTDLDSAGKDLVMVHRGFGTLVETHRVLNSERKLKRAYEIWTTIERGMSSIQTEEVVDGLTVTPTLRPHDRLWSFAER